MKNLLSYAIAFLWVLSVQIGCVKQTPVVPKPMSIDRAHLPTPNLSLEIAGLSPCNTSSDSTILLNSNEPVNIIVHGCKGSAGRFQSLAQVFAFHGQQTVCFSYNHRDSLMKSSAELIYALSLLSLEMESNQMTVIGHSQGGLISRKALIKEREDKLTADHTGLRLVTISAPYAGIKAADHCASPNARFFSIGLVIPICRMISGDKWYEITHPSPFIQEPGELLEQVTSHLKIVTDESGSCRRYDPEGNCVEDDFVFSIDEQYFEPIDALPRVENIEIAAGHAEIVGDYHVSPKKLIKLLQNNGIMNTTPPALQDQLAILLSQLYQD